MSTIRIFSWNVNGIRAAHRKGFKKWVLEDKPDVLCLQETKATIEQFPRDIQNMDDEHGAFWVSVINSDENVVEVDKSLSISIILESDNGKEIKHKAKNWEEVKNIFDLLLGGDFNEIKRLIKAI